MGVAMSHESACPICCHSCVRCCCPHLHSDNYPLAKYQSPMKASTTLESQQFEPVQFGKSFVFHQPKAEYSVHPHASDTEDQLSVISDQPKATLTTKEPGTRPMPIISGTLATLEFSLYYDIQKNTLTVHLLQAYNLPVKSSSTCVVLYLLPNKLEVFESQVVHENSNPAYQQMFQFSNLSGSELLRRQTLMFRIFQYSKFSSRDLVGTVTMDLADADLLGICTKMEIERVPIPTRNGVCGDILCSLTYKPEQSTIQGIVLRVANLGGSELTGTRDPYIKVRLHHKLIRQYQWKSSIKKQTVSPIYNEQFQFDVLQMSLDKVTLELLVMDYDRFGRDSVIGSVQIGADVSEDSCKTHWEELVSTPSHAVSRWHSVTSVKLTRTYTL
ncbi:synaptotagmin-7-like isoform X2 [Halichondria panicea]|uniref:synaptotagmin-7-like isoform X2 n=1 Tax=Halichondria panicea TaxID=6063 RepID=UPI00312BC94D